MARTVVCEGAKAPYTIRYDRRAVRPPVRIFMQASACLTQEPGGYAALATP